MKRWRKPAIVVLLSVVVVFSVLVCVRHRYPVLFHFPGSCACTDYSEEVEGLTVFNPFRDRTPEVSANRFFEDKRDGHCPEMTQTPIQRNASRTRSPFLLSGD